MHVSARNQRNYLIRLETLDEHETIQAFKKLEELSPKAVITIFITVDDDFKKFYGDLKKQQKRNQAQKGSIKIIHFG